MVFWGKGSMKKFWVSLAMMGGLLFGGPAIAEPDLSQWPALENQYRSELAETFAQKPIEEWGFDEIQLVAAKVAEQVYGKEPELVRAKMLADLALIPLWQGEALSTYQERETLKVAELELMLKSNELPWELFYGKPPQELARVMKTMLFSTAVEVKHLGQVTLMTQFIPDRMYRLPDVDRQLVMESYNDHLFVMTFDLSESGLLTPIEVQWLEPQP